MFEVILSPDAAEFYAAADKGLARKLARCFRNLETDPRQGNNAKRLTGEWAGYRRYRVGDWRVIYRIDDDRVFVAVIAHRREAYD
ncbi:MAG: type II toxin-antitoxin system RelE/ParE family toxin [Planctomycetes bacterium]|jgi:mRNA interferase RelE/StbE|nr:type II toxin-antitoxin system RelE/ParE family toxin [Planctomycetota bacterium]